MGLRRLAAASAAALAAWRSSGGTWMRSAVMRRKNASTRKVMVWAMLVGYRSMTKVCITLRWMSPATSRARTSAVVCGGRAGPLSANKSNVMHDGASQPGSGRACCPMYDIGRSSSRILVSPWKSALIWQWCVAAIRSRVARQSGEAARHTPSKGRRESRKPARKSRGQLSFGGNLTRPILPFL